MKVSFASDIVGVASSFGISVHQYREIKRDEDAYEIAQRWPMLAELHGLSPQLSEGNASAADAVDAAALPAGPAPAQDKSGLKIAGAPGEKAEGPFQPAPGQVQIAA